MSLPTVTMSGNVVSGPEIRFTQGGHAVARFRLACSERVLDCQTQQWGDGDTCFLTVEVARTTVAPDRGLASTRAIDETRGAAPDGANGLNRHSSTGWCWG